jgi:hypothetical protein
VTGDGYDVLRALKLQSWAEAIEKRSVEVNVVAVMRRIGAIVTVRGMTSGDQEVDVIDWGFWRQAKDGDVQMI